MKMPTLLTFTRDAGCVVVDCGPGWGGRYGYTTKDHPNCTECGYKSRREARIAFVTNTFGEVAGAALLKLLGEHTP